MSGNESTSQASEMSRRSALVAAGTGLIASGALSNAMGASPGDEKAELERIVEAMRAAMVSGDGKVLDSVLHDKLTYSHSDGRQQTKRQVFEELAGKHGFDALVLSEQTVDIVGDVGVVRHTFDSRHDEADGTSRKAHIRVLQVWVKSGATWELLARASTPIKA